MSNKYFIEVPINSEADLPKEEGYYFVFNNRKTTILNRHSEVMYFHKTDYLKNKWLNEVISYLRPVEPGVLFEKVSEGATHFAYKNNPNGIKSKWKALLREVI